jgi:transcriptional regulator with XRE-family HTH domain
MANRHNSVKDLLKSVSDDKAFNKGVESHINSRSISKILLVARNKMGLSQADVAARMNRAQPKVSRIEGAKDVDISLGDLEAYCNAVNLRFEIGFMPAKATLVQRVKFHYFSLKTLLDRMRDLAKGDKKMEDGVRTFTMETFVNVTSGVRECLEKVMPKDPEPRQIHVSPPMESPEPSERPAAEAVHA